MKLLQLNAWGGKLGWQIIDLVKAEQPDIICLQEVNDIDGPRDYLFASLDDIAEAAGLPYRFMSPVDGSRYQKRWLAYGNAILSREPLLGAETIFTLGQLNDDFDLALEADKESRNLQHVRLASGLHIFNHHGLFVPEGKNGNAETDRQMGLVYDQIAAAQGPVIFCGDLNLAPTTPAVQRFSKLLTNLSADLGSTYNWLSIHKVVCDYIMTSPEVRVQRFAMLDAVVSDHNPLILEFDL